MQNLVLRINSLVYVVDWHISPVLHSYMHGHQSSSVLTLGSGLGLILAKGRWTRVIVHLFHAQVLRSLACFCSGSWISAINMRSIWPSQSVGPERRGNRWSTPKPAYRLKQRCSLTQRFMRIRDCCPGPLGLLHNRIVAISN